MPKYSLDQEDKWRTYHPLEDTPDLFLKFARLYENGKGCSTDAILSWVHKYGLLGKGGGYLGSSEESIREYRESIRWAAGILAMYESALNEDEVAARDIVLGEFMTVGSPSSLYEKLDEHCILTAFPALRLTMQASSHQEQVD